MGVPNFISQKKSNEEIISFPSTGSCFTYTGASYAQAAIISMIFGDQVASESFNLSLELGFNFSNILDFPESQSSNSLNFGLGGNIKLSDNFFLSPTIFFNSGRRLNLGNYSLNTGEAILDEEFSEKEGELDLNYIDLNLPIYYQIDKWRIGLAPQVSFLRKSELLLFNDKGSFLTDISDEFQSLDYGFLSIFSYELGKARKGKGLFVQFRYYQGLQDVFLSSENTNRINYFSIHLTLPFISEELAKKNLSTKPKK